jgi:hypothetical protein
MNPIILSATYVENGNLFELDGSKERHVLISRVSHHQDQQANWTRPLVKYLEATFTGHCNELSCAVIMRKIGHAWNKSKSLERVSSTILPLKVFL